MSSESLNPSELLGNEFSTAVVLFHQAIAEHLGLSATEWKCLNLLGRMDIATPKQLADLAGLTTGAITGILDRLEQAGYVRREPNPHDRRSVIIRSLRDQEVQRQVAPIFASLGRAMQQLAGQYTAQELAAIQEFFRGTIQILREETSKLRKVDEGDVSQV